MQSRAPWVTWLFAAAVVAFAWQVTGFFPTERTLLPVAWSSDAEARGEWARLFTSILAHGNLVHLATNLLALLTLGPAVERALGPARTAALLLAAGVAGNLAQSSVSAVPVVGASGAIFGLVGVLLALAPASRRALLGVVPVPVVVLTAFYAALVLLVPAFSAAAPIAHLAHLGGLGAGVALGAATSPARAVRNLPGVAVVFAAAVGLVLWWLAEERTSLGAVYADEGWPGLAIRLWPAAVGGGAIALALGYLETRGDEDEAL